MTFICRAMTTEDLNDVLFIERDKNAAPWVYDHFANSLRMHNCWVIDDQGTILGFAILRSAAEEGEILNIAIHPLHRHRGYAKFLMNYIFDYAQKKKIKTVFLEVRKSNLPAQTLYLQLGFHEVGLRQDYYPARVGREDGLVMAKELNL